MSREIDLQPQGEGGWDGTSVLLFFCCGHACCEESPLPKGPSWLKGAMRTKVQDGNSHADWCLHLIELCEWWLEPPDTSWMWRLKNFSRFRLPDNNRVWRLDFCFFGTPWRKRTRVATSLEDLRRGRHFCQCRLPHVVLRGRSNEHRKAWTAVAQPYAASSATSG